MARTFHVFADWQGLSGPQNMGILRETGEKGRSVVSFEYDKEWLKRPEAQSLDPELQLYPGRQFVPAEKPLFGVFLDSAPDRWGRMLIKRREASAARSDHRPSRRLSEIDFVVEVNDFARVGALRFRDEAGGDFLAPGGTRAIPPWVSLRSLEEAVRHVEEDQDDADEWLKLLLAPGSSLGGARPKASIQAPDGTLWIAKFPSKNDTVDTGAWEKVVYDMAGLCGLQTVNTSLERFSAGGSTFLLKRFDRTDRGGRLHYASALNLLGKNDGASAADGSSYLELAEFIRRSGSRPKDDLKELWSRIVFSIAVSNTDDHLRNHGFLLERRGWRLSPLFDVNPDPDGYGLSLNVSEDDNALDFDLALNQSRYFGLSGKEAHVRLQTITGVVAGWRRAASSLGISPSAIRFMDAAFRTCS
jgi:serine/threonine-protein kinase HipA